MKSSELVKILKKRWLVYNQAKRKPHDYEASIKNGNVICPMHGSNEVSKGLQIKIMKDAELL